MKKIGEGKEALTSAHEAAPEKRSSWAVGFYVGFVIAALVMGGAIKWLVVPAIFAIVATLFLVVWNYLDKNHRIIAENTGLIFLAILVVFQAYGYGKYMAINIKEGVSYKYVSSGPNSLVGTENKNIRYPGEGC